MNLKQSLHSLLADNETSEVIKQLRSITEGSSLTGLNAEVERIATRFQENIEESHHELSDEGTINRENSSIRYALFAVINKLPEDAVLPEAQHARRLKIALFIIAAVALFAIVALNLEWFKIGVIDNSVATATPTPSVTKPVVEQPKIAVAPLPSPTLAPIDTPTIKIDTALKVDTLRKKKVRRVKKASSTVVGDTFKAN